jgi:hypothetical protein
MTEIKIEKKKPFWPWIFLLLGIVAAIWFFFFRNDGSIMQEGSTETEINNMQKNNSVVSEYVLFIDNDPNVMGLDHEYTSEAIDKLTLAVEAKAKEQNIDIAADIANVMSFADQIKKDPTATNHSDKIRSAANLLSKALVQLQQQKFPNLATEATATGEAASAIDPKVLTLDQREVVKNFFKEAADLLEKMN